MIKGFREFIMRGNVVDLAVAVVHRSCIQGRGRRVRRGHHHADHRRDRRAAGLQRAEVHDQQSAFFYGAFINTIVSFLIVAAAIYFFVVLPLNKLAERRAARLASGQPVEELGGQVGGRRRCSSRSATCSRPSRADRPISTAKPSPGRLTVRASAPAPVTRDGAGVRVRTRRASRRPESGSSPQPTSRSSSVVRGSTGSSSSASSPPRARSRAVGGQGQLTHSSVPSAKTCRFQIGNACLTASTRSAHTVNASRGARTRRRRPERRLADREQPDPVADREAEDVRLGAELCRRSRRARACAVGWPSYSSDTTLRPWSWSRTTPTKVTSAPAPGCAAAASCCGDVQRLGTDPQ